MSRWNLAHNNDHQYLSRVHKFSLLDVKGARGNGAVVREERALPCSCRHGKVRVISSHTWNLADVFPSNGIRFSITDLSPPTARLLPTIYQDRCDISLYDAQTDDGIKVPIPQPIINEVVSSLQRFKSTCEDFGVPGHRIRIVATEATRTALNSAEFLRRVQDKVGITTEMLLKEEEGRIGALGIASSFQHTEGLVMDLGGGSIQLSWLECIDGEIKMSANGSVSLPYGAAAVTKRLAMATSQPEKDELHHEITSEISKAFKTLDLTDGRLMRARDGDGVQVFLSGGGFRGWGYVLMSRHTIQPYPIPLINGFSVNVEAFLPSNVVQLAEVDNSTFRISSRRASQVPAVSFLISALTTVLDKNLERSRFHFAQGGLREGLLFSLLPAEVRSSSPLLAATSPYGPTSAAVLTSLLHSALPSDHLTISTGGHRLSLPLLTSAINLYNAHASCPKDIRASSALRSTTTGLLANAHGISHDERALLGLILFERWRGDLPPTDYDFHSGLQQVVGLQSSFWAAYVGRILNGLGELYPAGKVREDKLGISAVWTTSEGKRSHDDLVLGIVLVTDWSVVNTAERWCVDLGKLGKKKNWAHSKDGKSSWGFKIECSVRGH